MSILIKGMKMPKDCNECPITFFSGGSKVCKFGCLKNVDCPLISVPTPHGRIVDIDAVLDGINNADDSLTCGELIKQTTIIEAEE